MAQLFISYSRKDQRWLESIRTHLKPLEREGIDFWDDSRIQAGEQWKQQIEHALSTARVVVLLVSAHFLASDFINSEELPKILALASTRGTKILYLILSPCYLQAVPSLTRFQAINSPSRPLIKLSDGDKEDYYVQLVEYIKATLVNDGSPTAHEKDRWQNQAQAITGNLVVCDHQSHIANRQTRNMTDEVGFGFGNKNAGTIPTWIAIIMSVAIIHALPFANAIWTSSGSTRLWVHGVRVNPLRDEAAFAGTLLAIVSLVVWRLITRKPSWPAWIISTIFFMFDFTYSIMRTINEQTYVLTIIDLPFILYLALHIVDCLFYLTGKRGLLRFIR